MGKTKNLGHLAHIVTYDASNNITLPANLTVTGTITGYATTASLSSYATQTYVTTQIANLVASAPTTLDTLNELAAALGNDPSFATTIATSIGTKVPSTRTITINGTAYDLSADRSWTISSMIYPAAGIALSTGTGWGVSITNNSANWNTAYGWGNHASAGYLTGITSTQVTNALGYTPVTNARTITINGTAYDLSADRSWTVTATDSTKLPLAGGTMTGSIVNNTDGAVMMESNASENNNWLFKENSKAWGLFWFNRGSQSGQTIGGYTTVGAELMFMGGSSGIAMPTGWTGYYSGSNIAAMISNYNGYIYSASTVYAATSMVVGGNTVLHAGNYSSYVYSQGTSDGRYVRKDTNSQFLRPYYEYGNYLTSEAPSTLVSQMNGSGGLRVDFGGSTYTATSSWSHILTWSGYNRYSMCQIGSNYYTTDARLYYRQTNNHDDAWAGWKEFVFTSGNTPSLTMSGSIKRSSHSSGFFEGSYNNVGGNSFYTNPIYTIGSSYNPSDSSLGIMYGIGYSHPNFWGSGKVQGWGMYVCSAGVIDAVIGGDGASTSIWAKTDIVAYSDARVKENVEVIKNALEKVQAIRGVTFTRNDVKDKDKRSAGVIAQEVLAVLPEVVSGTEQDMYSVAYGNMAGLFIEAIKEQQKQIEELKSIINGITR